MRRCDRAHASRAPRVFVFRAAFSYSLRPPDFGQTPMSIPNPFFNQAGRLRSGWRFTIFCFAYIIVLLISLVVVRFGLALVLPAATSERFFESNAGFVVQGVLLLCCAALVGWLCGHLLEDLPWRALGWALHRGWRRDLLFGFLLGAASIGVATAIGAAAGGLRFSIAPAALLPTVALTLASSAIIFALGAAAEEMLFRGYPLQTLMRSWPHWLALIPTSLLFAAVHLGNPNTVSGFTFGNTFLAGVWLAVAYARTRSLWFPLGLHWGWNWTMGALLGLNVSGIEAITPEPLLRAADKGPAWLTGGAYGPEGGAACTLALALSMLFIWRTRLLDATEEMKLWTERENPQAAETAVDVQAQ